MRREATLCILLTSMKKAIYYTLIVAIICGGQTPVAHAETVPVTLLITEIQTGGASDATEEFVEIYNPSDQPIDVTGWLLQYRAASQTAAQSWPGSSTKATIACPAGSAANCKVTINPQSRLVLVHTIANIAGALPMAGGFSASGGEIRLYQPGAVPVVHDFVGYGTAADSQTAPAAAPGAGQSIKRIVDAEGVPITTGSNIHDFIAGCGEPSPGQSDTAMIPFATGCAAPGAATPSDTPPAETSPPADPPADDTPAETPAEEPGQGAAPTYLPILITELLPDPAPPQQDSTDEFIELYNPNAVAVTLNGYVLQTGGDYRYSFTLGDTPLGPHTYLTMASAVSKLSLVNSGSGVRLIDPNGNIVAEVPNYGDAKEGESWMQDDTGWHWTLTPTPYAANILTLPAPKVLAPAAPAKKTATKTTTAKTATPKAPKAPAATKKATTPAKTVASQPASARASDPPYWLFIPLCCLAIGYAVYEYRQHIGRAAQKTWAAITRKQKPLPDEE